MEEKRKTNDKRKGREKRVGWGESEDTRD